MVLKQKSRQVLRKVTRSSPVSKPSPPRAVVHKPNRHLVASLEEHELVEGHVMQRSSVPTNSMIKVAHISKLYKTDVIETVALNDVSFTIEKGEFVAIMGPSGSGKSTLMHILGALDQPTSGTYTLDGENVETLGDDELADIRNRKIGFIFQAFNLLPRTSAMDNVMLPLVYAGVPKEERIARAKKYLEMVGLGNRLLHTSNQLSGGQQQRVALGRALIKEPDVLLFDEPLSNLDAELRLHMRAEIKRLQRSLGITAVLVTHDQVEALSMADRILVLREGRLQQLADPHTLYHHPTNQFVARFIGSAPMNFLPVELTGQPQTLRLVDTGYGFALPAASWTPLEDMSHGPARLTLGVRPEDIPVHPRPGENLLPATITLLEPLGREVLLSITCGTHGLKVLVPTPCDLASDTAVWLDLSQGPHHFFDPQTGAACLRSPSP